MHTKINQLDNQKNSNDNLICVVSYLHNKEKFSENFRIIAHELSNKWNNQIHCVIFTDESITLPDDFPTQLTQIIIKGTKYQRLQHLLTTSPAKWILSIDNDIECDAMELIAFITDILPHSYAAGWGKIAASQPTNTTTRMVAIDKLLSHNIIRPFLWKLNIGISIPGQCFMILCSEFSRQITLKDTYLDDLAIGLHIRLQNKQVYASKRVLGKERPNTSFCGLLCQRKRWANGYISVLKSCKNIISLLYVIFHGIAYHFLWIIWWCAIFYMYQIHPSSGIATFICGTLLLSFFNYKLIFASAAYQLLFPTLHIWWAISCYKYLINTTNEK